MANALVGDVALVLGGEAFTLRMDMNAMCELESETGRPAHKVLADIGDPDRRMVRDQRALVWAALRRHHPQVTLAQAGELMARDPEALWAAMGKTLGSAMPEAEGNAVPGGAATRER